MTNNLGNISLLREAKREQTEKKKNTIGFNPIDDYGYIPWDEEVAYAPAAVDTAVSPYGFRGRGRDFRRWLESIPAYIHPASALAGGWTSPNGKLHLSWKPEDLPEHLYPVHKKYNILFPGIGAMNHLNPDMSIGLELGWGGLLEKLRRYEKKNLPIDTAFYDGEKDVILGIQGWIQKHVELARKMAGEAADPGSSANLLRIAEMNEWLIEGAPRNLREACQFLAWFQSVDRMWATGGALGQLDELLRPFYERDLNEKTCSDHEALWYLASLFYNDTHYSQISGMSHNGRDLTSKISFLILEAAHLLLIPSNLSIRLHKNIDPDFLNKSIEYLIEDGTGPAYACSKGLDEGYQRNGLPPALARMRQKVGCNWTALPGIEYPLQDVTRLCLVSPFLHAFNELAALPPEEQSMEELWRRYLCHLTISVDTVKEGYDIHMEKQAANNPELVLNLFCHGPIERGLDVSEGGVDIYLLNCDGVGLATAADSFAAVEQRVFQEKLLSVAELAGHLQDNFANAEQIRLMLRNIPRYGCGDSAADRWATRISLEFSNIVHGSPTKDGFRLIPGLFSHEAVRAFGERLPATPNGRRIGEPISHGPNPDFGFMPDGSTILTAKANAVAAVQPGYGNTAPLQIEIESSTLSGKNGIDNIKSLLLAHEAQGGTLININVISKEQILEAYEDPSLHPDLVIRVSGFSTYFSMLPPESKKWVVDRVLMRA